MSFIRIITMIRIRERKPDAEDRSNALFIVRANDSREASFNSDDAIIRYRSREYAMRRIFHRIKTTIYDYARR